MFLKIKSTPVWINLNQVQTVMLLPDSKTMRIKFVNGAVMTFDRHDQTEIVSSFDLVSSPQTEEGDPHDEILTLSESLLTDLSDPATPGEMTILDPWIH